MKRHSSQPPLDKFEEEKQRYLQKQRHNRLQREQIEKKLQITEHQIQRTQLFQQMIKKVIDEEEKINDILQEGLLFPKSKSCEDIDLLLSPGPVDPS